MSKRRPRKSPRAERQLVYGRNPVLELLRAGWPVREVWVAAEADDLRLRGILNACKGLGIPVRHVTGRELTSHVGHSDHQGVVAHLGEVRYADLDDVFARAKAAGEPPFVAVLDSIQDPQNLGAILRSAEAAGVHGVIIPKRRAVGLTPAVAKASAGAFAHLPVVQVTNLVRTVLELKDAGLWIVAADQSGETSLWDARLDGPIAVVVGSEGKGIHRLLRETCDFTVRIPMLGKIESLNASVAAALLFYEVRRRRKQSVSGENDGESNPASERKG